MMLGQSRAFARSLLPASIAATLLLVACKSPDNDGIENVDDLTGTITGVVADTGGHGIAGATVSYAGGSGDGKPLSVTTAADGQFVMSGVIVNGISGTLNNDANGPITLVVTPPAPAGYLSATVQASPTAQSTGTVGGGTVFIDNFNVGVGTVILPALKSTVSGVVRDASTGAAVSGARLSLTFLGVEPPAASTGVTTSYDAGVSLTTSSNASGEFSFAAVYSDSCALFLVNGYAVDNVSGSRPPCPATGTSTDPAGINLRTGDSATPIAMATVTVSAPTSGDTIAPVVSSVVGVIDPTQTRAQLESSVTTKFQIRFSEPLQGPVDASAVYAVIGTGGSTTSAPLAATNPVVLEGNTLTVTLASAPPAGSAVTLHILREALKDTAGNGVAGGASSAVAYDSLSSQELLLAFTTFASSNTIANAATVAQASAQKIDSDIAYVSTDALLDTVDAASESPSAALAPGGASIAYPTTPLLEQLNTAESASALGALLDAVQPSSDTRTLDTGTARVSVTAPANATDFIVWLQRGGSNVDASFFPVATSGGSPQTSAVASAGSFSYIVSPNGADSFDLLIKGRNSAVLAPGDVFHIVSRNAAGVQGGSATLALTDNGKPGVALQLLDIVIAGSGSSTSGGGGGVVTPASPATPATVLLSITPQSADVSDATADYASDNWCGSGELLGLSHAELKAASLATTLCNSGRAIGDADGTAAFLGTSVNLGIAITEASTYTGVAPTTTGVSTALSDFAVQNSVSGEGGSVSDLFIAKVGKIFQLAGDATAGTARIDLTKSIQDLNGNAPDAGTRAFVRLRDYLPPLMTQATYDGTSLVFTFNEPVKKSGAITFQKGTAGSGCTGSIDLTQPAVVQSADLRTFTVAATAVTVNPAGGGSGSGAVIAGCFDLPAYAEAAYGSASVPHAAVAYESVPDTAVDPANAAFGGNTWAAWTALSPSLGIKTPSFAMANISTTP